MKTGSLIRCGAIALALTFPGALWAAKEASIDKVSTPTRKPVVNIDPSPITEGRAPALVSYADVIEPAQHAVVSVASSRSIRRRQTVPPFPWMVPPPDGDDKQRGIGSGVVVTSDGYVLTNNHVVEGADELVVILPDDRQFKAAVVGTDPKTDVAVIKINAENLPTITLANSDKVRVGDIVFAIGNPLGIGQTVTMGIVSATSRSLGILKDVDGYESFIQTDAAINQGNSGGALIDAKGRLIGLNSAILSPTRGSIGIGFAIPSNLARGIMDSLIETGKVTRGYLGVLVDPLTPELAEALGLKKDAKGVVVNELPVGDPAERAGMKRYDVILAINGRPVTTREELKLVVAQLPPDSDATIKIFRKGRSQGAEQFITVKLGRKDDGLGSNELLPGVTAMHLSEEQRLKLDLDERFDGLLVTSVAADSPYSDRIAGNMIIIEIDREHVTNLETAKKILVPGRHLLAVYYRGAIRPVVITVR